MQRLFVCLFILLSLLIVTGYLVACGDDDDDNDDQDDDDATDDDATDDDAADDDAVDDDAIDDDAADDDTGPSSPFDEAEANPGEWVWIEMEGSICRDGSSAGIGARLQTGADKLMIFLEGGGACFDADSCSDNPENFNEDTFAERIEEDLTEGIFNDDEADNPLAAWNIIFVPYCSGDLHSGDSTDMTVPGVDGVQQFLGYANAGNAIAIAEEYFTDIVQVMLSGQSAGGFGTLMNYPQMVAAFAPLPVVLLNDSGPLHRDNAVLSPLLQLGVRALWGVVVPEDCTECNGLFGDGIENIQPYLAETYSDGVFGLFSTTGDETIRDFFGVFGEITPEMYRAAIIDLRDNLLLPTGRWSTYYMEETFHTFTTDDDRFYEIVVDDTPLTTWVADLLTAVPDAVGP